MAIGDHTFWVILGTLYASFKAQWTPKVLVLKCSQGNPKSMLIVFTTISNVEKGKPHAIRRAYLLSPP